MNEQDPSRPEARPAVDVPASVRERPSKDIRVVVVTPHDTEERAHWSGIPFYLVRALEREFGEVSVISGTRSSKVIKVLRRLLRPLRLDPLREQLTSRILSLSLSPRIQRMKPDVVIGIAASHMIAALRIDAPLINFSDATFAAMLDYYEEFSGMPKRTVEQGIAQESAAVNLASMSLLTSDWAVKSAISAYGVPAAKVARLPMGANLDVWPAVHDSPPRDVVRLLFVGVKWRQKGGDVAVDVLRILKQRGLNAELHIVGCHPPAELVEDGVICHGFLRKAVALERAKLDELFATATFFLLPTRAEAYGLVFAEASAHGLPIVARRTGGTPSVVEDDVNGVLIEEHAGAEPYAEWIMRCWHDEDRYERLRKTARAKFERELNWDVWVKQVAGVVDQLLSGARPAMPATPS